MFEPNEESIILEIVRNFFDVPSEDMMKIGDLTKDLLFGAGAKSEEEAVKQLKQALQEMPKEHALMAGMFISGLLRCNLSPEIQRQYMQAMAEAEDITKDEANDCQETKADLSS
jgi:DNA-binding transcriptional regulator YdaS (Cro superfamily)